MKFKLRVLAVAGIVALTCCGVADAKGKKNKGTIHGKVAAVDGTSIKIVSGGTQTTIKTDENTKFYLDDKPATLADVKPRERLISSPSIDTPASEIRLMSGKKHKKGAAATTVPTTATLKTQQLTVPSV